MLAVRPCHVALIVPVSVCPRVPAGIFQPQSHPFPYQWLVNAACGRPPTDFCYETFGSSGQFAAEPFRVRVKDTGAELVIPRDRSMLASRAGSTSTCSRCR